MHPSKIKELEYELKHETNQQKKIDDMPKMIGMFFYNIPNGEEEQARTLEIKQLKSGKWAMKQYDKSGRSFWFRKQLADEKYGPGKWWEPKMKEDMNQSQVGTISQSTASDVTISNPDGTKTTVPVKSGLLAKDPQSGRLVLNKSAVKANQPTQQGNQNQNPFATGQKVAINSDIEHKDQTLEDILKIAGLK
jgi:hypothetical protein